MRSAGRWLLFLVIVVPLAAFVWFVISLYQMFYERAYVLLAFPAAWLVRYALFLLAYKSLPPSGVAFQGPSLERWFAVPTHLRYLIVLHDHSRYGVYVHNVVLVFALCCGIVLLSIVLKPLKWILELDALALVFSWLVGRRRVPALPPPQLQGQGSTGSTTVNIYLRDKAFPRRTLRQMRRRGAITRDGSADGARDRRLPPGGQ